jgi:UDP-N-acetylmuramate dehydrogenase
MENLALIPGTVGGAPIQNIGAYGVEIAQFISEVEVLELETGKIRLFTRKECEFAYRDSIFKNQLSN